MASGLSSSQFTFSLVGESSWAAVLFMRPSMDFPGGSSGKESACQFRRHKRCRFYSWGQEDPLEESMATLSSLLAWRNPWTEEPGGLQSIGS